MTLDTLLSQPLAPVRDDGFSARVLLAARRIEERRRLLLWSAVLVALLPLAGLAGPATQVAVALLAKAAASPAFAGAVGAMVLLWAFRPRARF